MVRGGASRVVITRHAEVGTKEDCNSSGKDEHGWKNWDLSFPSAEQARNLRGKTDRELQLSVRGMQHNERAAKSHYKRYGAADFIIQSQYRRAQALTYEQLKHYSTEELDKVTLVTTPLVNERSYGSIFGLTDHEVDKLYPDLKSYWKRVGPYRAQFPNGTSLHGLVCNAAKVKSFISILEDQVVHINGHMGTILAFRAKFENWTEEHMLKILGTAMADIPNCCTVSYVLKKKSGIYVLQDEYYPM